MLSCFCVSDIFCCFTAEDEEESMRVESDRLAGTEEVVAVMFFEGYVFVFGRC